MGASLYVHVPFCRGRCGYCAFVSSEYHHDTADAYLDALSQECDQRATFFMPETVYIGGGTPTALDRRQIERLADILRAVDLSRCREMTVEANPGTLTVDKLMPLVRLGVNRVSLGVQTFQPHGLALLGRKHDARAVRSAIAVCREAGIWNISLDLIYGWPGQTPELLVADLEAAADLGPTHLSCYGLTFEPGTPITARLERGEIALLGEDAERIMFDLVTTWLPAHGYGHYEISSFSRPCRECRHNRNYWIGEEYVGLGAGAFSYRGGTRFSNVANVDDYIARLRSGKGAVDWEETLDAEKRARELAVIWLRMREGIDRNLFHSKTGYCLEALLAKEIPPLLCDGWLEQSDNHLRLAQKALPVADAVLSELIA